MGHAGRSENCPDTAPILSCLVVPAVQPSSQCFCVTPHPATTCSASRRSTCHLDCIVSSPSVEGSCCSPPRSSRTQLAPSQKSQTLQGCKQGHASPSTFSSSSTLGSAREVPLSAAPSSHACLSTHLPQARLAADAPRSPWSHYASISRARKWTMSGATHALSLIDCKLATNITGLGLHAIGQIDQQGKALDGRSSSRW